MRHEHPSLTAASGLKRGGPTPEMAAATNRGRGVKIKVGGEYHTVRAECDKRSQALHLQDAFPTFRQHLTLRLF